MDDPNLVDNGNKPGGLTTGWRIAIGLLALIIVGMLGYSYLDSQTSPISSPQTEATVPPEVQSALAGPQATAEADPGSAQSQFELGNAFYQAGQWTQAVEAYKKAIEIDPSYQAAYANLGATYYQQLQFDLAASQYEKALELNPQDGESAYNLGAIYLQQALTGSDQPDVATLNQAIEQIQNALKISPNLAEPYFSLGVAYMASSRPEEAIDAFETFLELNEADQNPQAQQEAERYLQLLRSQ